MFQEELETLQTKILRFQEQLNQAEENNKRLASLHKTEQSRANALEKKVASLINEAENLKLDFSTARQAAERVPKLEEATLVSENRVKALEKALYAHEMALEAKTEELRALKGRLADKTAEARACLVKLEPVLGFVETYAEQMKLSKLLEGYIGKLYG